MGVICKETVKVRANGRAGVTGGEKETDGERKYLTEKRDCHLIEKRRTDRSRRRKLYFRLILNN